MHHARVRDKSKREAAFRSSQREVCLLGVEKERVVPGADGIQTRARHAHRGAGRPVERPVLLVRRARAHDLSELREVAGHASTQDRFPKRAQQRRAPAEGRLGRAVLGQQPWHGDADASAQLGEKRGDGARREAQIGVEHEDRPGQSAGRDSCVDAGRVAHVRAQGDA
jgi:hypothetical protein